MESKKLNVSVDDLIVEYMILKVQFCYKNSYTIDEFVSFLNYFEQFVNVVDIIYDMDMLFDRFFERKKDDWSLNTRNASIGVYKAGMERVFVPHIERHGDCLVATNRLSDYDYSVLKIKFMSKQEQDYIRNVIISFLDKYHKINNNIENGYSTCDEKNMGNIIASLFVKSIWNEYVMDKIRNRQWPNQCTDIEEYLMNMDLASIIKLPSIRDDLMSFYDVASRRIAVLLHNDYRLEISNMSNPYLPYYNYNNIIFGYNHLFDLCKNCFYGVSVVDNIFVVNNDKFNKYSNSVITKLDDVGNKKLVRSLNKIMDKR